ncbi:TadE/TadG family type IV pilus assembly protein [Streptomyces tropicalis]|uniref:Pilus assembly protein n=1 Tax=Streptomyces tropicalis TaxID=3034234 RepID=A0ABT6A2W9_9ACTN|nr:TadE family protein [Streptomyces tropicalis]MDF3298145.1 pilus assembly protein [Streptomyces tropicalis]
MNALGSVRRLRADDGQVAVEFLGMLPTIIVTLVVLWQCVLVGYTYTLAGNAADEAVRAGTAAQDRNGACRQAAMSDLPGAWRSGAGVDCGAGGGYVTADVSLEVPVLFPGAVSFPFQVKGHAGAVEEVKD